MAIIVSRMVGADTTANRPAASTAGRLYYATDTGTLYYDTGAAWRTITVDSPLPIANGGTGQTTQTAAMDALSPTTTKGDFLVDDGTNVVRRAAPTNQNIILADSSQASGWRNDFNSTPITLFSTSTATFAWLLVAGAPESFGGANKINCHKLDFTRFRQGRIYAVGKGHALNAGNFDIQLVDITNTQNISDAVTFPNDAAWYRRTGAWTNLNAATYGGDAEFEIQCVTGAAADTLDLGTVRLELR